MWYIFSLSKSIWSFTMTRRIQTLSPGHDCFTLVISWLKTSYMGSEIRTQQSYFPVAQSLQPMLLHHTLYPSQFIAAPRPPMNKRQISVQLQIQVSPWTLPWGVEADASWAGSQATGHQSCATWGASVGLSLLQFSHLNPQRIDVQIVLQRTFILWRC